MKKTDPDYIAKLEKAIADKYGKASSLATYYAVERINDTN